MKDNTASTELTERLAALGRHPVDPATASQHLTAMAGVSLGRTGLRHKLQVAGALMAGLFIGGTGLATAGALGELPEKAAEQAIAKVTFDRVEGDAIKADKVAKAAEKAAEKAENGGGRKCDEGENHGQAVRAAAQADGATGESVSTVARNKTACAAKPADQGSNATGTETADEAKTKSENSGQGAGKSEAGRAKAETARPDNSGASTDDLDEESTLSDDNEEEGGDDGAGDGEASGRGRPDGKGGASGGTGRVELPDKP